MYCPARYGARISQVIQSFPSNAIIQLIAHDFHSQAFTATDSSVTVEIEEIFFLDDIISSSKACLTDGVGTMSPEFAKAVQQELFSRSGRPNRKPIPYPRALQIRFQGSKGMLTVDWRLQGRAICIRVRLSSCFVDNASYIFRTAKHDQIRRS